MGGSVAEVGGAEPSLGASPAPTPPPQQHGLLSAADRDILLQHSQHAPGTSFGGMGRSIPPSSNPANWMQGYMAKPDVSGHNRRRSGGGYDGAARTAPKVANRSFMSGNS